MTRRPAVVKVQIARKELGLDDDVYRSILKRLTGETSSAACTDPQLGLVLEEFKAKGWTPKVVAGGRKAGKAAAPRSIPNRPADHPSAKKARALWLSLWNLGEVRDPSEAALEAFARRQLSPIERLQWADQGQTYKLIEALKAMAERAGWSQDVAGLPLGTDPIMVLKSGLAGVQASRLGQVPQFDRYMTLEEDELDSLIRCQGERVRRLAGIGPGNIL